MTTIPEHTGQGLYSRHLQRRTAVLYALTALLGLLPSLLEGPAWLEAFALGLWFPGAGFIAVGGWSVLLLLPALLLSALAAVAWFGAGMIVAPVAVWLGAGVLAAILSGSESWAPAPLLVVTLTLTIAALLWRHQQVTKREQGLVRERRNAYLAEELATVSDIRAAALERSAASSPEMTPEQIAGLRYAIDRALQPAEDFRGFDRIDQFQTSALRYQINQLGWAIAVAQSRYAPSFHGYFSDAQRRLIERYLQASVLGYWRWERLWGHLSTKPDPVGRDNIMLTGYYGLNLALYMGTTGDHRYLQPGCLEFRVSKHHVYRHNATDVLTSLLDNYRHYHDRLCLYPCEPNWVYSGCNLRGACTIAAFDRLLGSRHWPGLRPQFTRQLEREFMRPDAGVVALRSSVTGIPVPFPMPDAVLPQELNPVLPELAQRYWAIVRHELLSRRDGAWQVALPERSVDFGNYRFNEILTLACVFGSAREMGDEEVAAAMLERMNRSARTLTDGALYYEGASTLANATMAMDRLLTVNAWSDAINKPVSPAILQGPLLSEAPYPNVLVAQARSDGQDLRLVLYPGAGGGLQTLQLSRLRPGQSYRLAGAEAAGLVADAAGGGALRVTLSGRHEVHVWPER